MQAVRIGQTKWLLLSTTRGKLVRLPGRKPVKTILVAKSLMAFN